MSTKVKINPPPPIPVAPTQVPKKDDISVPSFATLKTEAKFWKEGLKKLNAFHKAGLAYSDQGAQLSAFFHEFSEALSEEPTDPITIAAQRALEKLRDFQERFNELLNDANRKILQHGIDPLQAMVDSQLSQAKEARKKAEKAQLTLENAKKRKGLASSKEEDTLRATYERTEAEANEMCKRVGTVAGIQCLKLYQTWHKSFEHAFKAGAQIIADMEPYHGEFRKTLARQAQGATEEIPTDSFTLGDTRKMMFNQLIEHEKRYMVHLTFVLSVKNKLDGVQSLNIASEVRDIFGNTEEIFSLHVAILTDLEKGSASADIPTSIATICSKHKEKLDKLYTAYVRNYSLSLSTLRQLRKLSSIDTILQNFRHFQDVMTSVKLSELLALPCRHVHKFKFLIQTILENTSPSEKGWPALRESVDVLSKIIEGLEKAKALSDKIAHLLRLKKVLADYDDELVDASRVFLYSGDVALLSYMTIAGSPKPASSPKPVASPQAITSPSLPTQQQQRDFPPGSDYHLFLFNDVLVFASKIPAVSSQDDHQYKYLAKWPVTTLTIEEESSSPAALSFAGTEARPPPSKNIFRIAHATGTLVLVAVTEAQRAAWLARLRAAVSSRRRTQVFGTEVDEILRRPTERGHDIPSFVSDALELLGSPGVVATEGLFRLSGSAVEVGRAQASFDAGEPVRLREVHVVSSLLKLWLRLLPTPLLLSSLRPAWLEAAEASSVEKMKALVAKLPKSHRFVLCALLGVLKAVAKEQEKNMMSPHNLAIVFAPTLLRAVTEADTLVGTNKATDAIEMLIENFDAIFAETVAERARHAEAQRLHAVQSTADKTEPREIWRRTRAEREAARGRPRSHSAADIATQPSSPELSPHTPASTTVRLASPLAQARTLKTQDVVPVLIAPATARPAAKDPDPEGMDPKKLDPSLTAKSMPKLGVLPAQMSALLAHSPSSQSPPPAATAPTAATVAAATAADAEAEELAARKRRHTKRAQTLRPHRHSLVPGELTAADITGEGGSRHHRHSRAAESPKKHSPPPVSPRTEPEPSDGSPRPGPCSQCGKRAEVTREGRGYCASCSAKLFSV